MQKCSMSSCKALRLNQLKVFIIVMSNTVEIFPENEKIYINLKSKT